MRRFFAPLIEDEYSEFSFDRDSTRHLQKVLRINSGDEILAFDGRGNEYRCLIQAFENGCAMARAIERVEPSAPESRLSLTLAAALIKGDKFDLVIQKAVELGVTNLAPIVTMRSDVRAKNVEKKLERWRKIIIESSKQCGRATLMTIDSPAEFSEMLDTAKGTKVMFAETNGNLLSTLKAGKEITAFIGPEGGWDTSEIELARKNDTQIITLGGRIIRAETAAISFAAIIQNHFGDLN